MRVAKIALLLILLARSWAKSQFQYSCITTEANISECNGNQRPEFDQHLAAFVKYANRINETGWAELELVTNKNLTDEMQAYYAGYLEGFVTTHLIESFWTNTLDGDECETFSKAIQANINSTIRKIGENSNKPYWQEVSLTLYQVAGLDDGFSKAKHKLAPRKPHLNIKPCGIILLNLEDEFDDLKNIINVKPTLYPETRCSALIKVIDEGRDVLVGHNTWSSYKTMLRIIKKYSLNYSTSKAKTVVMSSYPGTVFSTDDFYITSNRLVVQETTNENFNRDLYKNEQLELMVFEFIRNTVANRLATSGAEWANIFTTENSGTYNNQFMIVDFNRFKPFNFQDGFLYIIEQLPGYTISEDQTKVLINQTYWPSYNLPYYKKIYNMSHTNIMYAKYGDHYSYEKTARALILARDHHKVHNLTTMYHLMRYNDYKHDPISRCNCSPPYTSENAISARNDLNDPHGKYPIHDFTFRSMGAIDAKMTNSRMVIDLEMIAVSGPTNENVPSFSWATTRLSNLRHVDQPVEWNFKPVITKWTDFDNVFSNFQFDS